MRLLFPTDMKWQNKLFILIVILLAAGMAIASWDIARKTTFPGSKGQLKERIKKQFSASDTTMTPVSTVGDPAQNPPK